MKNTIDNIKKIISKKKKKNIDLIGIKKISGFFDKEYYLNEYTDVRESGMDPLFHYLTHGHKEGRKPINIDTNGRFITNEELTRLLFDEEYYLLENPDVKEAGVDPFEHYTLYGWKEGRQPSLAFDGNKYLNNNQDVASANINPLVHYTLWGRNEGREKYHINGSRKVISASTDEYSHLYRLNQSIAMGANSHEYSPLLDEHVIQNENKPKIIAYYLPQFHPFPENDKWWGTGFTEWRNVSKAVPQFVEHYQPKIPSELGYYDLRVTEIMQRQAELAKQHGIDGFCFHYYWFAGKRLMERPVNDFIINENIDFPFCLCWANENWTRRWDGAENDVLISQEHSINDHHAVFDDLLKYLKDRRYICVNGKPVVLIYRPQIIEKLDDMLSIWRYKAVESGLPGLHIVATNSFGFSNYKENGFDAIAEFPPHGLSLPEETDKHTLLNDGFEGKIYDYSKAIESAIENLKNIDKSNRQTYYPGVMPSWDNTARKPQSGHIFHNSKPSKFYQWLKSAYQWAEQEQSAGDGFIFINAWNEWAEGAYLEPDRKFGYANLNVVSRVKKAK